VQATTYDPYAGRRANSLRITQAIYLAFGVIEGLLLIRFFLRALGANPDAGFAQAIYAVTGVLVGPFVGLFGTPQIANGAALELSTLIALIVYAAIGWLLTRAGLLIFGESRSSSVASVTSNQTRVG
jgi:fucose permease